MSHVVQQVGRGFRVHPPMLDRHAQHGFGSVFQHRINRFPRPDVVSPDFFERRPVRRRRQPVSSPPRDRSLLRTVNQTCRERRVGPTSSDKPGSNQMPPNGRGKTRRDGVPGWGAHRASPVETGKRWNRYRPRAADNSFRISTKRGIIPGTIRSMRRSPGSRQLLSRENQCLSRTDFCNIP